MVFYRFPALIEIFVDHHLLDDLFNGFPIVWPVIRDESGCMRINPFFGRELGRVPFHQVSWDEQEMLQSRGKVHLRGSVPERAVKQVKHLHMIASGSSRRSTDRLVPKIRKALHVLHADLHLVVFLRKVAIICICLVGVNLDLACEHWAGLASQEGLFPRK